MASFKEDVNSGLILVIGAISSVLVIVVVIGLQAWFLYEERRETDAKAATSVNLELENLKTEYQSKLQGYRWVDREKQIAAIPLDQAKKILVSNKGKLPATKPS
jgi:hypothetical protein